MLRGPRIKLRPKPKRSPHDPGIRLPWRKFIRKNERNQACEEPSHISIINDRSA
jgi:hypothetical protein